MEWWQGIITVASVTAAIGVISKFLKPAFDVPYKLAKLNELSDTQDTLCRGVYYLLKNATTGNSKKEMERTMEELEIKMKLKPDTHMA